MNSGGAVVAAMRLAEWPATIPRPRLRGAKAAGLRYERAVWQHLRNEGAERGIWWHYWTAGARRPRLCQTDIIVPQGGTVVVLECKYTWMPEALLQLALYEQVVAMALGWPTIGVVVCRNLTPDAPGGCRTLDEAAARPAGRRLWHWMPPALRASVAAVRRSPLRAEMIF